LSAFLLLSILNKWVDR